MNKRAIVGGVIILAVMGLAFYQASGSAIKWQIVQPPETPKPEISPVPTIDLGQIMESYSRDKYGYTIDKPVGWDVQEITDDKNFDDRVVFVPGVNTNQGNISEISVTVVSKPANTQELATQKDWQFWLDSPTGATDSSGLVSKKGEKMIDGNRSVVLWQQSDLPDDYKFSIMSWVRKNNVNYYIVALGVGDFTDYENRLFDYVAGSFKVK